MIPLIRVHGTHAEAGATIGAATRDAIHKHTDALEYDLDLVLRYRGSAIKYLPWVVEELDAAAAAAEVDPLRLFAASVEELHASPVREAATTGCTDIAATPSHSADGHLLVGHNNDLTAGEEHDVVAIEWQVEDEPTIFTLGIGPWISVGWNEAGISVHSFAQHHRFAWQEQAGVELSRRQLAWGHIGAAGDRIVNRVPVVGQAGLSVDHLKGSLQVFRDC